LLEAESGPLRDVVATLADVSGSLVFAVIPWLVIWWPLYWLGQALAGTYARKQLSELMMLFAVVWSIALAWQAANLTNEVGLGALLCFLPLAWVPPVVGLSCWWRERRSVGRPPTMLVLRVFRREAAIQRLFDHVVERWRLSGNTVLIAGTDLALRTLDADEIFTFLDGRLESRFIREPADVAARVADFDLARDADGRFRINECYAHDNAWQAALAALLEISDVALMDLRSFQARNAGCRYELGELARARHLARVVVLTDAQTDRATAESAVALAPPGRFVWLDASSIDGAKQREVLESLFVADRPGTPQGEGGRPRTA
jgi:hypothetical protein